LVRKGGRREERREGGKEGGRKEGGKEGRERMNFRGENKFCVLSFQFCCHTIYRLTGDAYHTVLLNTL
jgi:hypothetical protein